MAPGHLGPRLQPVPVPDAFAGAKPLLQTIREEFHHCGGAHDKPITSASLARRWLELAEQQESACHLDGPTAKILSTEDMQVIALRAAQRIHEMDLSGTGDVSVEEWVHHFAMARNFLPMLHPAKQVDTALKSALRKHRSILADVQHMFLVADRANSGCLSLSNIEDMYAKKYWNLSPYLDRGCLSAEELQTGSPKEFAKATYEAMRLVEESTVSYAEFMAFCFGRRKSEVSVNLYDLSKGAVASLSPWLVGQHVEGVWHTGVVAFGKEYYFGGDIFCEKPGQTAFGVPTKRVHLGFTLWRKEEFHRYVVDELRSVFNRTEYDVINHNCNHFAEHACMWLTGRHIPAEVLRQSENLMKLPTVQLLRPLLNRWLEAVQNPETDPVEDALEGLPVEECQVFDESDLMPGMVVTIRAPGGEEGPNPIVGVVCSPVSHRHVMASRSAACKDANGMETPRGSAWVRYFGVSPVSAWGYEVALRTECLPSGRLVPGTAEDVGGPSAYHAALDAIMTVVASRRCDAPVNLTRCRSISTSGASMGLKPSILRRPSSCREEQVDDEPMVPLMFAASMSDMCKPEKENPKPAAPEILVGKFFDPKAYWRHLHGKDQDSWYQQLSKYLHVDKVVGLAVGEKSLLDAPLDVCIDARASAPPVAPKQDDVAAGVDALFTHYEVCSFDVPSESVHKVEEPDVRQPFRAGSGRGGPPRRSENFYTPRWNEIEL